LGESVGVDEPVGCGSAEGVGGADGVGDGFGVGDGTEEGGVVKVGKIGPGPPGGMPVPGSTWPLNPPTSYGSLVAVGVAFVLPVNFGKSTTGLPYSAPFMNVVQVCAG
jgi:hypothetical protein